MINGRIIDNKYLPVYLAAFIFILINSILMAIDIFILPLLPIILIVILLAIYALDKLLLITVFLVPFSVDLKFLVGTEPGMNLSIPTEPLLALIMVLFILKFLRGQTIDSRIVTHPVSLAIYFNIIWIIITSLTSTMPLVSFKFLVSRLWFVIPFYFLASLLFSEKRNIWRYLGASIIPMIFIIAYAFFRHSVDGFTDQQASHYMVRPFYNDHTSYGAVLAMLLIVLAGLYFAFSRKSKAWVRILIISLIVYFVIALVFSYTRAAWVSLFGVLITWAVIRFRVPWPVILTASLTSLIVIFIYIVEIKMELEKNKQTSSSDFSEHIKSILNIRHDESNLERINRWNSAIRMFAEKPIFGWGPGTYMFLYAPFQISGEKTSISTNAGDAGNAHSEYLGPLSESGIIGVVSVLLIVILTIRTGLRVYLNSKKRKIRIMSLAILLALISYYIHGTLNNYLDTDKASVLFWGFTAMLVSMDIYHKKQERCERLAVQSKCDILQL